MLDDLAVLEPEEVGERDAWLAGLQCQVGVGCDHVALDDGSLDVQDEATVLGPQRMHEVNERFGPVGGLGVVLDVDRPEVFRTARSGSPAKAVR
jgi:hypothetical protein